jgi:hypothetical protein
MIGTLAADARLGSYEVLALVGAGGMGEPPLRGGSLK